MRTLKFYLFIFYSTFVFSAQQMVVDSSNSVIVRFADGSEQYLNGGDVIEVLDPENWKRNIKIITTDLNTIRAKNFVEIFCVQNF